MWFALLAVADLATAQPLPVGFRHFTADDGLPSSEVHEVLQDKQGYLWFATDNGVSRYNGYQFENFGPLHGLKDPVVFHLQEDTQGRVWMKCMSEMLYYFENDSLYAFSGNAVIDSIKGPKMGIGNFYVDSQGQVFSSVYPIGLIRFSPAGRADFLIKGDHDYGVFTVENMAVHTWAYDIFKKDIAQAIDGELGKINQWELTLYDHQKQFKHLLKKPEKAGIEIQTLLLQDRSLLVARTGSLFYFKDGKLVWQIPYPEQIVSCFQSPNGEIYLGLIYGKGARRYRSVTDLQQNRFEAILEGYSVTCTLEDRQGGYWFSTTEAGVFYRPKSTMEIFDKSTGLPHDYITAVDLKNEQEAFVGTEGGGVLVVDSRTKKTVTLPQFSNKIIDVAYDAQREILWVADGTTHLNYLQNGNGHKMVDTLASTLRNTTVFYGAKRFHFSFDRKTIWSASHNGFSRIDPRQRMVEVTNKALRQKPPYATRTLDVYTSSENRTWVGNIFGLFELKDYRLYPPEHEHPAFKTRVEAITELPDDTLVIGSKGYGIVFWKNGQTASLTEADGLTANMLENLHVDANGTLWAGTLNGLNKVHWRWDGHPEIERITIVHGLPSNEITDVATWGNVVWVGTTKGLARFVSQKQNSVSTKPLIATVLADMRPLDLADLKPISFWENSITINFFAINYKMNGHIPYRYRLVGNGWAYTSNTSLNFPAMPSGERIFEVQAQNEDGVWSESATLQFHISPPWWQTWWFYGAAIFVGVLAVTGVVRYRTSQVRHEEQMKTAFYKALAETEMKALRSQMNPHFIFNCLNSINHFVVRNDSQQAAVYISKFSKLIRLVLDNSGSQKVQLEKDLEALRLYMDLEAMRFDGKFRYELWVDDAVDLQFLQIPPMLIQPYVENAIWHGLMHRQEGGSVVIDVKQPAEHLLHVEITDDGVGRERAAELESKTSLKHKPQGTLITAERLRMLSPDNPNSGKVSIHDLVDAEGLPCGTKVVLEIPV